MSNRADLSFGPAGRQIPIRSAHTFVSRFLGLMGRREETQGLWLKPCASIHTFMMRFDLDVVFLSKDERVVSVHRGLAPGRTAVGGRGAHSAVEMPSSLGLCDALEPGMRFPFERSSRLP